MSRRRELLNFALVGVAAAGVDAGVLAVAIHLLEFGPYGGRAVSYLAAATFAWACNRHFTFRGADRGGIAWQWLRYLGSGLGGGFVNFLVYSAVVEAALRLEAAPIVQLLSPYFAVGCGSLSGMAVNFALARRLVFRLR
ncbi:MAG: GtrA family protein [Pseudomonadota bacterium]